GDGTDAPALGRPVDPFACDHSRRSGEGDVLAVEVNVLPPQVEQFAAARSGVRGDVEEGEQPVLLRGGQELPELSDGPYGARLLGLRSWPLGAFYRVASDEFVHDDGIAERLPEHRVQVGNGRDGERLAVAASAGQQVAVQPCNRGRVARPESPGGRCVA